MSDITAKIRAKGLEATGVTEDLARKMFGNVGGHYMAIVEIKVKAPHGPDDEGNRAVDLVLTQVEPSTSKDLDDHLRELTRTLHYNRKLNSEDETLDVELEGTTDVEDLIDEGAKLRPHDFEKDEFDFAGACNICGQLEDTPIHADQNKLADPFDIGATTEDDPEPANPDDPAFDPHPFTGDPEDDHISCTVCGLTEHVAVHTEATVPA